MERRVGILHPGQMGASVGAAAVAAGHRVSWVGGGRSTDTRARAERVGLVDVGSMERLATEADVVVSVCPPASAEELARSVVGASFGGLFVDANAVSPTTSRRVAEVVSGSGATFVDGGLVGPPAWKGGTTRLYLSGEGAEDVADLFAGSPLEAVVIEGGAGAASALKACYAAWTKGSAALLLAVRALAAREGVEAPLLEEWARSQAGLEERSARVAAVNAPKAWRFVGEMHEIASAFARHGLPSDFHAGAAEVYDRLAGFKGVDPPPEMAAVVAALL